MIPFAPFEPDRTIFNPGAITVQKNAVPVKDGWGPLPSLSTYTEALPAEPKGLVVVRTSGGAYSIIAGTADALYKLNTSTYDWDEISKSTTPYNITNGDQWSFAVYGQKLIATNISDPVQVYDIDSGGNFADLGGSPPQAKYAWVAGDYLVLGCIANNTTRIQWSGLNDETHWTVGEKGSDYQDFPDGEDVTGGIGESQGAIVFQRRKIRYMQFNPASGFVFTFTDANPERGSTAPHSIVQIGARDFVFLTDDGFYRGIEAAPIGAERVDRWFFEQINLDEIAHVVGVADISQKLVWFQFADEAGTTYLLGYDWQLDRWCFADNNMTGMASLVTAGTTLEGLDDFSASIDALGVSLDSRQWKGGAPAFAGFDASYQLGFFSGANQQAELTTADVQIISGRRAFCDGARVMTDADDYTVTPSVSEYHGDEPTALTASSPELDGVSRMRAEGRLHRFKVTIAAGDVWKHAYGLEPVGVVQAGER